MRLANCRLGAFFAYSRMTLDGLEEAAENATGEL